MEFILKMTLSQILYFKLTAISNILKTSPRLIFRGKELEEPQFLRGSKTESRILVGQGKSSLNYSL